jgi:glutamyl-Q tRNA(Asp) synthetase
MTFVTRFAPSPTGPLHLGHAFSAMLAHDMARAAGGTFLLRIEDIDRARSRPEWEAQCLDDLRWLGLTWPEPVMRQSDRLPAYRAALAASGTRGLLYPCTCARRDIAAAAAAPHEGEPPMGPTASSTPAPAGGIPRGTASRGHRPPARHGRGPRGARPRAAQLHRNRRGPDGETGHIAISPDHLLGQVGDVVLARRGMGTSYHLAVVLDDAAQGVTHVTRGNDLFGATAIHVVLQRLLGLPTPIYHHHRLIRDDRAAASPSATTRARSASTATRAPRRRTSAASSGSDRPASICLQVSRG